MRTKYNSKIQNIKNVGNMPGKLDAGAILKNSTGLTLSLSGGASIFKGEWTEDLNEYVHGKDAPFVLDRFTIGVYKITDDRLKDNDGDWIKLNEDYYFPLLIGSKITGFKNIFETYINNLTDDSDEDTIEVINDIISIIGDTQTLFAVQQPLDTELSVFNDIKDYFLNNNFNDTSDYPGKINLLNGLASLDILKKYSDMETSSKKQEFFRFLTNLGFYNSVIFVEDSNENWYLIVYFFIDIDDRESVEVSLDGNSYSIYTDQSLGDYFGYNDLYTQNSCEYGDDPDNYKVNAWETYPIPGGTNTYWTSCTQDPGPEPEDPEPEPTPDPEPEPEDV